MQTSFNTIPISKFDSSLIELSTTLEMIDTNHYKIKILSKDSNPIVLSLPPCHLFHYDTEDVDVTLVQLLLDRSQNDLYQQLLHVEHTILSQLITNYSYYFSSPLTEAQLNTMNTGIIQNINQQPIMSLIVNLPEDCLLYTSPSPRD